MRSRSLLVLPLLVGAIGGCLGAAPPGALSPSAGTGAGSAFSHTDVFPGNYSTTEAVTARVGPYGVGSQEVTLVPSDLDGSDIMVYVMRPDVPAGTRVPVILDAGPYFPPLQGQDLRTNKLLVNDFVSHGFAFALVAVRGTGDSGACMDLMGPAERHDIDQAITWLGTQDWSNGNVGMFGGSYDGSTQWEAASTGNPHLKTIVPIAAIPDLGGFFLRNGSAMTWTPAQFAAIYWLYYGPVNYNPSNGRSPEHTAQQFPCPSSAEATATTSLMAVTGERDPLGYFAERDWRDDILARYNGTVYIVQGLQDVTVEPHNQYPLASELEAKGLVVKHTLGPWGHEVPWRGDWAEVMLRWYQRWLLDDPSVDIGPKAQVLDNMGMWRSEDAWPPADAAPLALHLTADGKLADQPGATKDEALVALSVPLQDPQEFANRFNGPWKLWDDPARELCGACPSWVTGPLDADLRFAGAPTLHLTVTPTGPGGHVTALMFAVHPDGSRERVGMAQMDLRFADGGETAKPVVPGQPLVLQMQFEPTDAAVPAGSHLLLELNQGSYGIRLPSLPTYPVQVQTGGEASVLTLGAFMRAPGAFHDAPAMVGPPHEPR